MIRPGTLLLLGSLLIPSRSVAQLPTASFSWEAAANTDHVLTLAPFPGDSSRRHKSPVLAWFLSWLVPGGGQGYNGQWGKAAAFFVPAAVGLGLAVSGDGFSCTGSCGTRDAGLVILAAASIGSQIEAPIAASRINRQARQASPARVGVTLATIHF